MTWVTPMRGSGAEERQHPPRWLWPAALLLVVAGFAISLYLTVEHYGGNTGLLCPDTGTVNCLKVTTGPYSEVLGLPVAVYGVAFFAVMAGLVLPAAWRSERDVVHQARLLAVVAGVIGVLYLVYVELFKAGALCLWCTGVHVVTLALFALVLAYPAARQPSGDRPAAEPERLGGRR